MKNINNLKPPCPPPVKNNIALPNNINIRYAYLPNGDRIMRANSTDTEYYLYDREDRIGDYDKDGNLLIAYTHGPGIDEPVAMTISGSTYFYIPDIQGSIRAIVDEDGNLMASYVYDVWGTLISYNGTLAEKNDYLYTGREYDWETGIYYYRARSYDSELGRFLQQDPEGMVDGPNMYVYVKNDPGNKNDPSGKIYWWCEYRTLISGYHIKQKYSGKDDKWQHGYLGCTMRRNGCSWYETRKFAERKECADKRCPGHSGYTFADIEATLYGWEVALWGGRNWWGGYKKSCEQVANHYNNIWVYFDHAHYHFYAQYSNPCKKFGSLACWQDP